VLSARYYAVKDVVVYKALIKAGADWKNINKRGKSVAERIIKRDRSERCNGQIKVLLDQGFDREKIRKLAEKYNKKNLLFLLDKVWKKK